MDNSLALPKRCIVLGTDHLDDLHGASWGASRAALVGASAAEGGVLVECKHHILRKRRHHRVRGTIESDLPTEAEEDEDHEDDSSSRHGDDDSVKYVCKICAEPLRGFRAPVTCKICDASVCAKCLVLRDISYVRTRVQECVVRHAVTFCKACVHKSERYKCAEVAAHQVLKQTQAIDKCRARGMWWVGAA